MSEAPPAILIVDDEPSVLHGVQLSLRSHGFEQVLTCVDSREVAGLLEREPVAVMLLDLNMPHVRGEEVLADVVGRYPDLRVIVVTAEYDVATAVSCMKLGATDYLTKPVEAEQLVGAVDRALEQSALRYENARLREQFFDDRLSSPDAFSEIITADPAMLRLFGYLEAISRGSQPVLVAGETGTGKELIARALHRVGRSGPFVAVNVAGLDDTVFADTLFGHVPGAYTGATTARQGMVDRAGAGTLFLDEIGDLSEASQVKLLRLLQEREYYPLGSDAPSHLRARVVAATHVDPDSLRQDLYYRLRSYQVRVPPLRERPGDLPLLVDHFLSSAAEDLGKRKPTVPPELFGYLANHDFPGNIRELQAMVFEAVARHEQGVMSIQPFLDQLGIERSTDEGDGIRFPVPLPTMREIEASAVAEALSRADGNQSAAARMLGLSRPTIGRHARRTREEG